MPAELDRVQRDRGGVEHGGLVVTQLVGHRENALHRVHDVVGIGTLGVVAVLAMEPLVAEVLADVVAALDAEAAESTAGVRGARHPRAPLPAELGGSRAKLHHLPDPLVTRNERELLGPEARVVPGDDVRVRAADGDRLDLAEQLEWPGPWHRHVFHREAMRLLDDQRAHR
jgi:hypothetical protein